MELITYNLTLDTHKNGVQTTLQGINVGDVLSRKIAISLTEGSSSYELPTGNLQALMYVTKPGSTDPSINACTIDDDRIIYTCNASDFETAGTVIYQLKIIDTRIGGANGVYVSAKFAADVWESDVSDSAAETSTTYTALENAVAQATEVYNSRLVSVVLDDDKMFIVTYADGTTYESDVIKVALEDIDQIQQYVGRAETAATTAEGYVGDCADYVDDCEDQVTLATGQATSAATSANTASGYADSAKSYAVGTNGAVRPGDNDDNAKHYKEVCEQIAGSMQGGFIPMGTITFSSLPVSPTSGWMYNISDEFTSDSRFKDGGGKNYASGTNVYATADLMWDCLSGAIPVVNGKSGNSITLDGADILMTEYTKPAQSSEILQSDTIEEAIGKLEKGIEDVAIPTKLSELTNDVPYAKEKEVKLQKDEWVAVPALANYTNYADSSHANENHWTMNVDGSTAIGATVNCSWDSDSWVGYTFELSASALAAIKGKTIELGACVYNPTYSTWCYYQLNINDGESYIQKANLHTGSSLIRENTDGISFRYTVPNDITALRFDLVQGSHSSTPAGSLQLGYVYIVDINQYELPDENNTIIKAVRKTSVLNYTYGNNQLVFSKEGSITMTDALGNVTELSNMAKVNTAITNAGGYIVGETISSGSESYTFSNSLIDEDSIIDIYYAEDSKEAVAAAKPSYSQAAGALTITFENALESDVTIDYVHIVNV